MAILSFELEQNASVCAWICSNWLTWLDDLDRTSLPSSLCLYVGLVPLSFSLFSPAIAIVIVITIVVSANATAKKKFRTINISANREMERIHLNRFNYRLPIKSNLSLFTIFSEHTYTSSTIHASISLTYDISISFLYHSVDVYWLAHSSVSEHQHLLLCFRQYVLGCAVSWLLAIYRSVLLRLFFVAKPHNVSLHTNVLHLIHRTSSPEFVEKCKQKMRLKEPKKRSKSGGKDGDERRYIHNKWHYTCTCDGYRSSNWRAHTHTQPFVWQ